ncbi:MAG: mercuric reductase [Rhodothalassiaceae bacterium]|nr:MAG: mercuric reductase [Rhodothalassiaceae bacterium]
MADERRKKDRGASPHAGRSFDLVVVGAGSAGFSAAIAAAEEGARVLLVGHGTIGGTCVNIGCVPSKALIRAADALHAARAAARFAGIEAGARLRDWPALVGQKDELVAALRRKKYLDLLPAYPTVSYLEGRARLVPGGVEVNGRVIAAERVVITTGARPAIPPIPGLDEVPHLTSTTALELKALPRHLIVLGAGAIGCELGQAFRRFGCEVTMIDMAPLLAPAEPEIRDVLRAAFAAEGIALHENTRVGAVRRAGRRIEVVLEGEGRERVVAGDALLVATGRRANTENLGLEALGIATRRDGGIVVDAHMQTTRPGIYAAGDVTGRDLFVYMAAHGGRIAALNALSGNRHVHDDAVVPWVVFTDPEIAGVGLAARAAEEAGHEVATRVLPLSEVPRALVARDARGAIKIVAERESGRILGVQLAAPGGADVIQTAALALRAGLTVDGLAGLIFPYLTLAEGLKLAAQTFSKDVARLSCCAG